MREFLASRATFLARASIAVPCAKRNVGDELDRNLQLPRYPCGNALWTTMQNPKFTQPVSVRAGTQDLETVITDVYECSSFLLRKWPGKRGPSHRAALQACHDASANKKPISSVRRAFALAAREAGRAVTDRFAEQ